MRRDASRTMKVAGWCGEDGPVPAGVSSFGERAPVRGKATYFDERRIARVLVGAAAL